MALQIPGYSIPQTPEAPNLLSLFQQGYQFGGGIADENGAKQALGDYVRSLAYGQPAAQPPAPPADPQSALVNGSINAAQGATDPALSAYFANVGKAESGGDPNAKNPRSSATGTYQFTEPTWLALANGHPELGLTPDGRTDPGQQERAMRALTMENARALSSSGQPVNPGTLYASHFLGAPTAKTVLGAPDDAAMSSVVSPEVVQANPFLGQMKVGQFKQWAASKGGTDAGGYAAPTAGQPQQQPTNGLPPHDVLMKLFQNPQTRGFAAQLVQSTQQGGKLTSDQQEYAGAVAQGYRGTFVDYQKELKGAGATTVNVGDNSSKFSNKADELAAGRMNDYVSSGNDAVNFMGDLKALTDLGKNVQTGKKTQILAALGPYAEALGVKIEGLDDAQAYDAIISRMAPQMRVPGSGATSDFEGRQFLKSLPSLGNTPEGNQVIIDTFQGIQDRKVKASEIANQALSGTISWQEADRKIAALGDPYTAFKKFKAGRTAADKAAPAPTTEAPPASYDGDPNLWQYMTPEQRALWQ